MSGASRLSRQLAFVLVFFGGLLVAGFLAVSEPILLLALPATVVIIHVFTRFPAVLIFFLALYTPFEEFILKWIPSFLYAPARYFGEAMILITLLHLIFRNWRRGIGWKSTPLDLPFVGLILTAAVSAIATQTPAIVALLGIKNLIRYIFLFYIVVNADISRKFVRRLFVALSLSVMAVSLLGFAQFAGGKEAFKFFKPRDVVVKGRLIREAFRQEQEARTRVFSTLGRYNHLGNFLNFFLCLTIGLYACRGGRGRERVAFLIYLVIASAALVLSYSRMSWVGLGLGVLLIFSLQKQYQAWIYAAVFISVVAVSFFLARETYWKAGERKAATLDQRYLAMFSPGKLRQSSKSDRLYALLTVVPRVLKRYPLFGVGPGTLASDVTGGGFGTPGLYPEHSHRSWLSIDFYRSTYINDSGWTVLLAQLGLVGLSFTVWLLVRVFQLAIAGYREAATPLAQGLALGFLGALAAVLFQNFVSFNLVHRVPALYFWLWAGILAGRESWDGGKGDSREG